MTLWPTAADTEEGCCDQVSGDWTVRVAAELIRLPQLPVTSQVNVPACAAVTEVKLTEDAVAPRMLVPFRFHWKVSGPAPVAATLKETDEPTHTVADWGCRVKATLARTETVAALLAVLLHPLVTAQV